MQTNRRNFLAAGVATLASAGAAAQFAQQAAANEVETAASCLDYGLSFLCAPATDNPSGNAVRFWVESRTTLFDDKAGTSIEFLQCASCKSENTFAEKDLFMADNYDFMPIFGGDDLLIFRRTLQASDRYREVVEASKYWGTPIQKLRPGKHVEELDTFEKIRDTTAAAIPLVSQTEITNDETGLRAIIECPVKTMNISLDQVRYHALYQVDTGPIAFPDLTRRFDRPINCLSLAFVAFNAPDFADFVVEQPTLVANIAHEDCHVYHYSKPFSLPAKNRLLAVGLPE